MAGRTETTLARADSTDDGDGPTPGGPPQGTGGYLTKITVNLIPRSMTALNTIVALTGDNKTDSINRALQVYAFFQERIAAGDDLVITDGTGVAKPIKFL